MCTVSFVPTAIGCIITSNRDENKHRRALAPTIEEFRECQLSYPKDSKSGGTWIAIKNTGEIAVLLNGAFENHVKQSDYAKSRGFIILDLLQSACAEKAFDDLNLYEIENFTVILYKQNSLMEYRWDGTQKHKQGKDANKPHIWSSATLYSKTIAAEREQWFKDWLDTGRLVDQQNIISFHKNAGKHDAENGLIINRTNNLATVSISSVLVNQANIELLYEELETNQITKINLPIKRKANHPHPIKKWKLNLKIFSVKFFNWEYWPMHVVYAPMYFYWFYLSAKAQSFFFFSAANPLRKNAGFALEKKSETYQFLAQECYPKTILTGKNTNESALRALLSAHELEFPLIAKPDMGERGTGVKLINKLDELVAYSKNINSDFLIQQYISYPNEVGIFYHRFPGEISGKITGIVGKEFLSVTGDGVSSIEWLILKNDRHVLQYNTLKELFGSSLQQILPRGVTKLLVPYGNHCRGAKFLDLSDMVSDELVKVIDKLCQQIPEFYFGRLDIKFLNWEKLLEGKQFSVIELNGAASEPTHMYDPKHSIFFAWKEIKKHWDILYTISRTNSKIKSIPLMSTAEGMKMLNLHTKYIKEFSRK